jgi:sugar phosphate isomerase/epimerase
MHPRLSVSAICSNGWTLDEDLRFWAEAGITRVGLALRKLEQAGLATSAERVAGEGLVVTNLLGVNEVRLYDESTWPRAQERLLAATLAAQVVRAGCVVVTTGRMGPLTWEDAAAAFAAFIAPVRHAASARGVRLAVEHTHALRSDIGFLHSLRDAIHLAQQLDLGVCVEVQACWTERGLGETLRTGVDRLALVQLSDFVIGTTCTPDRVVPGDGDLPLARFVHDVLEAGYAGPFDLELIGPRIDAEGYAAAISRAVAVTEQLLPAP